MNCFRKERFSVAISACLIFFAAALYSNTHVHGQSEPTIEVGNRKQLFIDKKFIASSKNIELTMNSPYQTGEVLIEADQPWELQPTPGAVAVYSSVLKDGDRVRIWYDLIQPTGSGPYDHNRRVCYAESKDGLHFVKPKLGLHEINGSKANNVVLPGVIGGCAVWIDPKAPPEHRYKTQTKVYPSGHFHMHSSPDGIHWQLFADIDPRGPRDTQTIVFWDKDLGRYLFYGRDKDTESEININCRCVRRAEMTDLTKIQNTGVILGPDKADLNTHPLPKGKTPVDYYGATVFPYNEADGVYIMLAHAFWHWGPKEDANSRATFDVRLATSRDSKKFERQGARQPFMRLGPEGRFDSRYVWAMPNPIRMGDEIWIYYVGSNTDHNDHVDPATPGGKRLGAVSRAVMRLDGFVSADAPYEGGQLTTPTIRFAGKKLELNLDTSGGGSVRVELLDEKGEPIEGYTASDAMPLFGNSVRMPVSWGDNTDVSRLAGKPIKIRFIMRDCKLYAFQFK
ncbi:MAG: hypothetical protein JXM70_28535 [Pirellulales bacterium]|nr:hypothetical protein [Pirellulales bacterium]